MAQDANPLVMTFSRAEALAVARLCEEAHVPSEVRYPLAARMRSALNADRCDDCGTLDLPERLDCRGDVCICVDCGGEVSVLVVPQSDHPYRTGAGTVPEDSDVPAFMRGHPVELD